jgi:hypothetical protein
MTDEVHFEKKKRYAIIMLSLSVCVLLQEVILLILILILILNITLHPRIANQMVMGSCCRGGIVHIRGSRSRARGIRSIRPTALWRFRASTSNSLSGRPPPPTNTQIREIYRTYAQQDIQVCGDDHFQPPKRQYPRPKALSLLRVSI